jgi:hypothetical protein
MEFVPQDYYSKWNNFAAKTEDELAAEEAKEKEAADKALGKDKAFSRSMIMPTPAPSSILPHTFDF